MMSDNASDSNWFKHHGAPDKAPTRWSLAVRTFTSASLSCLTWDHPNYPDTLVRKLCLGKQLRKFTLPSFRDGAAAGAAKARCGPGAGAHDESDAMWGWLVTISAVLIPLIAVLLSMR
jgi:hypothetical protein